MKIKAGTDLIPCVYVGTYGNGIYDDYVCDFEDMKQSILDCGVQIVEDTINEICPDATVSNFTVWSPSEYNFRNDTLDFDLEVPDTIYQEMYDECINDPNFAKFLKDNYSSYSGFMSFYANNLKDFASQDPKKSLSQLLAYQITDYMKDYNQLDYDEALVEWLSENCPEVEEELGSNAEYQGVTIYYTGYRDDIEGFNVEANGEDIASFPAKDGSKDALWAAYNEAYAYCENELGVG